ncbi:MAG: lysophospholipid acyltransferase family protein [Candidatus Alcyoniella australis]|nr:lysophospholipid acyltransferase family protein [Candidatus Alcyoniella australis]
MEQQSVGRRIGDFLRFLCVSTAAAITLVIWGTPWNVTPFLLRKVYYRYTVSWFRALLFFARAKVEAQIDPKLDLEQPYVVVSNHLSHYDIPATAAAMPMRLYFVAKRSLFFVPILASGLRRLQMICIDRRSTKRAYCSLDQAVQQIAQGCTVLLYPEGGIGRRPHLRSFGKGAFNLAVQAQVPLLPVVVSGSFDVFDLRRASSHPGIIRVKALDPVPTAGLTREDVPRLVEQVRQMMIEAGAVPED